jgi:diguanylate cyclase (GGDEF)-like protein
MKVLFWTSTLCLFSFLAGYFVFSWLDMKRRKKASLSLTSDGEAPSEASLRDRVTNLYNRKHLLIRLCENMARCERSNERMAIVLWDINGFVDFNNQFGQAEGDVLLKEVAEAIRKCLRLYDESFRYGPDEFCSLLMPADEPMTQEVVRRVKQAVADIFNNNPRYKEKLFSISSGIVFYPGPDKIPESILHAAGQELYKDRHAQTEVS